MLKSWKDHKFIVFTHEFYRPFLAVWMFFRDILMYIFDLFKTSWKALPVAMNKNTIIPSFIASTITCVLFYFCWFIYQILLAYEIPLPLKLDSLAVLGIIFLVIVALPLCWGFTTVASVIKAKQSEQDDSWRNHASIGKKGVRFFLTYVLVVLVLLLGIVALSSVGLLPILGKPVLALLAIPFYFASIVIFMSVLGLVIGSCLFGGFYLSGDYDESASFRDKTKSLFRMVGNKVVDFVAVIVPASTVSFLFIIVPFTIMLVAVKIMQFPGTELYDIRWPNVFTAQANTNEYPGATEEEDLGLLNLSASSTYRWDYPSVESAAEYYADKEIDIEVYDDRKSRYVIKKQKIDGIASTLQNIRKMKQDEYKIWRTKKDYEGKQTNKSKTFEEYVDFLNEDAKSMGAENNLFDYSNGELILLAVQLPGELAEMPDGYDDGTCYVSTAKIRCTSTTDSNHVWEMDGKGGEPVFNGESHPSFFIWVITFILVFVCSLVISVPLGCLYSAIGSIFYGLYSADYNKKYGFIKRLIATLSIVICVKIFVYDEYFAKPSFDESFKEFDTGDEFEEFDAGDEFKEFDIDDEFDYFLE